MENTKAKGEGGRHGNRQGFPVLRAGDKRRVKVLREADPGSI